MEKGNEIEGRTLSIDCSVGIGSVAVLNAETVLASSSESDGSPARAEEILLVIKSVLSKANVAMRDVSVIAASVGPGSYSGIRIGLATAFGLAGALSRECVGVSVLDALALTAQCDGKFVAAVGVGKRHIGWSEFEVTQGDSLPASNPMMQSDEDFGIWLGSLGPSTLLCDRSLSNRAEIVAPAHVTIVESQHTIAELVGTFAYRYPERTSPKPIYLRDQAGLIGQPTIQP